MFRVIWNLLFQRKSRHDTDRLAVKTAAYPEEKPVWVVRWGNNITMVEASTDRVAQGLVEKTFYHPIRCPGPFKASLATKEEISRYVQNGGVINK
ncbi:hypothetical protein [Paenibacillus taichungensis]|jgi:hypothetical protein